MTHIFMPAKASRNSCSELLYARFPTQTRFVFPEDELCCVASCVMLVVAISEDEGCLVGCLEKGKKKFLVRVFLLESCEILHTFSVGGQNENLMAPISSHFNLQTRYFIMTALLLMCHSVCELSPCPDLMTFQRVSWKSPKISRSWLLGSNSRTWRRLSFLPS